VSLRQSLSHHALLSARDGAIQRPTRPSPNEVVRRSLIGCCHDCVREWSGSDGGRGRITADFAPSRHGDDAATYRQPLSLQMRIGLRRWWCSSMSAAPGL
jgi:hypothetical protein